MLHNDSYNRREYVVKILLKIVGITVDDAVVVMTVRCMPLSGGSPPSRDAINVCRSSLDRLQCDPPHRSELQIRTEGLVHLGDRTRPLTPA